MTRLPVLFVLCAAVIGCSLFGARTFGFAFPAEGNVEALPVLLTDTSGSVADADVAPRGFEPAFDEGFGTIAENPNAIVVHWIGGACDASVAIDATGGASLDFTIVTTDKARECNAIGISRAALIHLSHPADASRISVRFEP